jgi:tetratricopeptide (TPR) repeat protein
LTQQASGIAAPFGLTTSDGEGLQFVELTVSGFVQDPLAYTELHMTFENPSDRVKEGRFQITLPAKGSVARFAMRIGDNWQEGEMVERRTAQRVFDDFLHRRQDPALLEQEAANEFSARVFPIPARGRKELILSYSQELGDGESYTVPLRGLPGLARYSARIVVHGPDGDQTVVDRKNRWVPDADLTVSGTRAAEALRSGRLVVARVSVPGDTAPAQIPSLAILVDTSASRAAGFSREVTTIERIAAALPPKTPLLVAAFDQDSAEVYNGTADAFDASALRARRALGATDTGKALDWLTNRLGKGSFARVILVGDGVVTAGAEGADLAKKVLALGDSGVQRLDAITIGGIRDDAALARLTRAGLAHDGVTISGELPASEIVRRLHRASRSGLKVEVAGSEWVQPAVLDGVQPGDEVLIHTSVPEDRPLSIRLGETSVLNVRPAPGEPALVGRACAASQISLLEDKVASLGSGDVAGAQALRNQMLKLSTTYRVSSPLTAFLVLESDQDYARYGIDRHQAGDIWTVGDSSLVAVERSAPKPVVAQQVAPESQPDDTTTFAKGSWNKADSRKKEKASHADREALVDEIHLGALAVAPVETERSREPNDAAGGIGSGEAMDGTVIGGLGARWVGSGGSEDSVSVVHGSKREAAAPVPAATASASDGDFRMPALEVASPDAATAAPPPAPPAAGQAERAQAARFARTMQFNSVSEEAAQSEAAASAARMVARPPPPPPQNVTAGPGVTFAIASVDGPMSRDELTAALSQVTSDTGLCLETESHSLANAPVTLTARINITADGAIDRVGFEPQPSPRLASCLTSALERPLNVAHRMAEDTAATLQLQYTGQWMDFRPAVARGPAPWTGQFADVMNQLRSGESARALELAVAWREENPGDVLALVALGEAAEAVGDDTRAARAYGSIIDLFPSRADLRRFAGNRLDRLHDAGRARELAMDTYRRAVAQRPDHPSGHHLLGMALLRAGHPAEAFDEIAAGLAREYPANRFLGAKQILAEDLGLAAAAWSKAEPSNAAEIDRRLSAAGGSEESEPSVRFVLSWETDDNDVDFHIHDRNGSEAYFANKHLPSGGDLYADVTTGYGPECFTIRGPAAQRAFPYWLDAHYYSRGPMGYGMGKVEIIEHDGHGGLAWESRPFVVMQDQSDVDLGRFDRPLNIGKLAPVARRAN